MKKTINDSNIKKMNNFEHNKASKTKNTLIYNEMYSYLSKNYVVFKVTKPLSKNIKKELLNLYDKNNLFTQENVNMFLSKYTMSANYISKLKYTNELDKYRYTLNNKKDSILEKDAYSYNANRRLNTQIYRLFSKELVDIIENNNLDFQDKMLLLKLLDKYVINNSFKIVSKRKPLIAFINIVKTEKAFNDKTKQAALIFNTKNKNSSKILSNKVEVKNESINKICKPNKNFDEKSHQLSELKTEKKKVIIEYKKRRVIQKHE